MTSIIGAGASGSSAPTSNWLADTMTAIQNSANPAGILGALSNMGDGSVSAFLSQTSAAANNFATIAQTTVSNASAFYAQLASQNQQQRQQDQLQQSLDQLNQTQNMVQPENKLDPVIFFPDGTTIDTTSNLMTRPDGTQYDVTTGAKYVDPASIVQMANGAYLNTSTNILTMGDGTQIDTVTGLKVSTSA
jgi:acylphosphatase